MSINTIASRYAKSLIDLAQEQDKLDRIRDDVEYFVDAAKVRDLYLLLKSPIVNTEKKNSIFKALFEERFDKMTFEFLKIILRKGREMYLPEIADSFVDQYRHINEISPVKLTTATTWTEEKLEEIKDKIRESNLTYKNIDLDVEVDSSILGGFVIEFEDKLYDASVLHQLEEMRKAFTHTN